MEGLSLGLTKDAVVAMESGRSPLPDGARALSVDHGVRDAEKPPGKDLRPKLYMLKQTQIEETLY